MSDKTKNYYNVDSKTGKINAGPYTGLTLDEAKYLNKLQWNDYSEKKNNERINQNKEEGKKAGVKVSNAINKAAKEWVGPGLVGTFAAPPLIGSLATSLVTAPSQTLGSFAGGTVGGMIANHSTSELSDGKYSGWGDMVSQKTGIPKILGDFTNPGTIMGSGFGQKLVNLKLLPKPNPNAHYRNIGGRNGYLDAINTGTAAPPAPPAYDPAAPYRIDLTKTFSRAFYARKGQFSDARIYKGPYAVEAQVPMRNGWGGNWGFAPDPRVTGYSNVPIRLDQVKLLKQYRIPKTNFVVAQETLPKFIQPKNYLDNLNVPFITSIVQNMKESKKVDSD